MGFTSIWHWLIVLVIVVLIFGTKKLRNVGRDLGSAVHDFKEGLNQGTQPDQNEQVNNVIDHKNDDKQA